MIGKNWLIILFYSLVSSLYGCKSHSTLIIMESIPSWVEVRSGDNLVFADSVSGEPITGYSVYIDTKFDFRDSLYIKQVSRKSEVREASYKLKRARFVVVDMGGLSFEAYSTNRPTGGI